MRAPPRRSSFVCLVAIAATSAITACAARRPEVEAARAARAADDAASGIPEHAIVALDGRVQLRIRSSKPPKLTEETAEVDVGAQTEIEADLEGYSLHCSVISGYVGIAHGIESYVARAKYEVLDRPKVDVEAIAGHPLLVFNLESYSEEPRGPTIRVGGLAGAYLDDATILCLYAGRSPKIFRGAMRHLVGSAREPSAKAVAFRSIFSTSSTDRRLGFDYLRVYKDAGTTRLVSWSSEILSSETEWTSADGVTLTTLDEAKHIKDEQRILRVGKSTQIDTTLERVGPTDYRVHGIVLGRTKRETFGSPSPLTTPLSRASTLAAFVRGDVPDLAASTFDALTPNKPVVVRFEREGGRRVKQIYPGKNLHCEVDERGLCAKTWNDADGWSAVLLEASGTLAP